MATKAKQTFSVYFDIEKVQKQVDIQADTFEQALEVVGTVILPITAN